MLLDKGILKAIWAGMYILCAVLGFVTPGDEGSTALMTAVAVLFFVPPALLLWRGYVTRDSKSLRLVRLLALICLIATAVLLVANFLSILGSELLGRLLYWALVLCSVPMVCGQIWALSIFAWALLLSTALALEKKLLYHR